MPVLALVALFIVVPIVELAIIIRVGQTIGLLPTVALLLADSLLGSLLLRSQGRAVWRRFTEALGGGRVPHREVMDGALVIFGGALLLTPGFATDVVGLLLLFPPTRAVARRGLMRLTSRRVVVAMMGATRPGARADDPRAGGPRVHDVEGTATDASTHSVRADEVPRRLER